MERDTIVASSSFDVFKYGQRQPGKKDLRRKGSKGTLGNNLFTISRQGDWEKDVLGNDFLIDYNEGIFSDVVFGTTLQKC